MRHAIAFVILGAAASAHAAPAAIDRIVAVVGEHVVTLSELRERARPFTAAVKKKGTAADAMHAEAQLQRALLEQMIDETLKLDEAKREQIVALTAEIDAALRSLAADNATTVAAMTKEAESRGITESYQRDVIARQIVEGKLLQRRMAKRGIRAATASGVSVIEAEREAWLKELRDRVYIEVRL